MLLGIPVIDNHALTAACLESLDNTIEAADDFAAVIVDNNSEVPYSLQSLPKVSFEVTVIRNGENEGYYWPLTQLYELYDSGVIGLCHNDVFFYENGWDRRMNAAFATDPLLMLIGLCGSSEVDECGGRGAGTMCNFRGEKGQKQENTGKRVQSLQPALVLDSLFMMFRRSVIPTLKINADIAPCHFYDKIWPMRVIEAGFHVGVLGVEIDHIGGRTANGLQRVDADYGRWCDAKGLPKHGNAGLAVYKEAERRWLTEYRDQKGMFPARIDELYKIKRL